MAKDPFHYIIIDYYFLKYFNSLNDYYSLVFFVSISLSLLNKAPFGSIYSTCFRRRHRIRCHHLLPLLRNFYNKVFFWHLEVAAVIRLDAGIIWDEAGTTTGQIRSQIITFVRFLT